MQFSKAERELFSELILQTIYLITPGFQRIGRHPPGTPVPFEPGDYVGGQSDMGNDAEIHLMFQYCGIIGRDLSLLFDPTSLRKHVETRTETFGVELLWAIECFFSALKEWHLEGWDHRFFSRDGFRQESEYGELINRFKSAGYLKETDAVLSWADTARSYVSLMAWGSFTDMGEAARSEASRMYHALPPNIQTRFLEKDYTIMEDVEKMLSNHWYQGAWNKDPVRGDREPVYMRLAMPDRAFLIKQLLENTGGFSIAPNEDGR